MPGAGGALSLRLSKENGNRITAAKIRAALLALAVILLPVPTRPIGGKSESRCRLLTDRHEVKLTVWSLSPDPEALDQVG